MISCELKISKKRGGQADALEDGNSVAAVSRAKVPCCARGSAESVKEPGHPTAGWSIGNR